MMEIKIDLIPNLGLKNIQFGIHRNDVQSIIRSSYGEEKFSIRSKETECYFRNSLQFTYEQDDTLTLIETAAPPPIYTTLLGINIWEIPGDKLLTMLLEQTNDEIIDICGSQIFKSKHITLWGLNKDYDHIGNYQNLKWGAIGIGDKRFYKKMVSLKEKL